VNVSITVTSLVQSVADNVVSRFERGGAVFHPMSLLLNGMASLHRFKNILLI